MKFIKVSKSYQNICYTLHESHKVSSKNLLTIFMELNNVKWMATNCLRRTRSRMFNLNPISEELRFFSSWNQIIFKSSPPEVFLGKVVLKICSKFTGEYPCQSVISIKLQINFIEITLRYGCSPLNLLHITRTPFPMNTSGGLFLDAAFNGKNKVQRLCAFIMH